MTSLDKIDQNKMHKANFFFDETGQLRSGFRVLCFIALFIFLVIFFGSGVSLLLGLTVGISGGGSLAFYVASSLASLAAALTAGWLCSSRLEKLPFRSLGAWFTKGWLINLVFGLLLGIAALSSAALIATTFGGLAFSRNHDQGKMAILLTFLASFLIFAAAAAFEEALFRGYILQTMMRSGLTIPGILLTSILFATVHNANPSANVFSWANTFIAGIWFAIAYLKTRDLWLVTGMHLTWNWTQGAIFGIEVSGLTEIVSAPLMRETDNGPAWLTGGDYGMEGGIAATAALIISTLLIYYLPYFKPTPEMIAMTSDKSEPPA